MRKPTTSCRSALESVSGIAAADIPIVERLGVLYMEGELLGLPVFRLRIRPCKRLYNVSKNVSVNSLSKLKGVGVARLEARAPYGSQKHVLRTIRARTISIIGKRWIPVPEYWSAKDFQELKSFDDGE
jgi:hypothetical protein